MPSFFDSFRTLFRRRTSGPETSVTSAPVPPRPSIVYDLFSVESGRRARVLDCQKMVEDDPRVEGIIDALSSDAVKGGFEFQIEGPRAEEARAIAESLIERVDFWKRIDDWVRLTFQDGDSFLEIGVSSSGDIVDVSRKPPLEMHRWSDDFDQFYDPERAFWWADSSWTYIEPPPSATFFADWQMIHARFRHDENRRYGRPLFSSARKSYKRMTEGEIDVSIRRKTRAGLKYLHVLEDATENEILSYMERNKASLDNPFSAVSDFFSSKKTSISVLQGDAQLDQIGDVMHHIRTFWVASPLPMSLLGYGQDLNRDVLDEQKEQYDATKEQLSVWVFEEFVAPLIERQWLLKGIWPENLTWSVQWASKNPLTAPDLESAGRALNQILATGLFSDETVLRIFAKFVPDFDVEAELVLLKQREAENLAAMVAAGINPNQSNQQPGEGENTDANQPPAQ